MVALLGAFAVLVGVVLRRASRLRVTGESMRPTLEPGDRVVVWRPFRPVAAGAVVVLRDPERPGRFVVKRVAAAAGATVEVEGRTLAAGTGYVVLGDRRSLSVDSRHYGPVPSSAVVGTVVYRYAPAERSGRLRYHHDP